MSSAVTRASRAALGLFAVLILAAAPAARASSVSMALTDDELRAFNSGASYGPQTAIRLHSNSVSGPLVFGTGDSIEVFGAPGTANVASLLFVFTFDPAVSSLGGDSITVDFSSPDLPARSLVAADFFPGGNSDGQSGFPLTPPGGSGIDGIGDGEVNGIKFPSGLHAGLEVVLGGIGSFTDGVSVGAFTVSSPVDLRIDIFGVDANGRIINNTPNSGAAGVTTHMPAPAALPAGLALLGLLVMRRRRA